LQLRASQAAEPVVFLASDDDDVTRKAPAHRSACMRSRALAECGIALAGAAP
jgi:hypothetical protein